MPAEGKKVIKYIKIYALTVAAMAIPLLIERCLLQPMVARAPLQDPAAFGTWVWFLAGMMFVAMTIGYGAGLPLLRSLADLRPENRTQWLRYARRWGYGITLPILFVVSLTLLSYKHDELEWQTLLWGFIAAFAAAASQIEYLSTSSVMRVAQHFVALLAFRIAYVLPISVCAVWLFLKDNGEAILPGVALAYVFAFVLMFSAGRLMVRTRSWPVVMGLPSGDDKSVRFGDYFSVASGAVVISLCDQAVVYVPRVMAGLVLQMNEVAVLVASTTGAALCLLPISMVGSTALSLLSRKQSLDWSHRQWSGFVLSVGAVGVLVAGIVWGTRNLILDLMYPTYASQALKIYPWVTMAASAHTMSILVRPLALRFLPIQKVAAYSSLSVLLMIALMIGFSSKGVEGIAIGYAAGAWGQFAIWAGFLWSSKGGLSGKSNLSKDDSAVSST